MNLLNALAFSFGVYFLIALILIHFLKGGLSIKKDTLSRYALGRWGFLITIGLLVVGVNQIIIASEFLKFNYFLPSLLIGLSGIGAITVGVIKIKENSTPKAHEIGAAMQFFFFPLALISYFILYKNSIFTLFVGLVTFIFFLVMVATYKKKNRIGTFNYGLIQKINILFINLWIIIIPYFGILN
jgi:hypothetical protein